MWRSPGPGWLRAVNRYCRVGLSRQMRMNVTVEYTLLMVKRIATEAITTVRAGEASATATTPGSARRPDRARSASTTRDRADSAASGPSSSTVNHDGASVDRHLAGDRRTTRPPATPRRPAPCALRTPPPPPPARPTQDHHDRGGVAHGERAPALPVPRAPGQTGHDAVRHRPPQQVPGHGQVELHRCWSTTRRSPLPTPPSAPATPPTTAARAATPSARHRDRPAPGRQCGDGERDERSHRRLLEEQQTGEERHRTRDA